MKKSQLREAVRKILKRKLQEQVTISHGENGKIIDATEGKSPPKSTAKYAYIMDKKNPADPRVQLNGNGNFLMSQLKEMCVEGLGEMVKWAEKGRYDVAIGKWEDITKYVLYGLDEVTENTLQEAGVASDPQQPTVQVNVDSNGQPMNPSEQAKITALEAEQVHIKNDLAKKEGNLAKITQKLSKDVNDKKSKLAANIKKLEAIKDN